MRFRFAVLFLTAFVLAGKSAGAEAIIAVVGPMASGAEAVSNNGVDYVVARLNAAGGLLGQRVKTVFIDDGCDPEQAVLAAEKALATHPVLVFGHNCSAASIRAAPYYGAAGVLQITSLSTNPRLTEMGIDTLFRTIGRDDQLGDAAATLIAQRWPKARIGVVDDGNPYGKGLADFVRQGLAERQVPIAFNTTFTSGAASYSELAGQLARQKLDVLYFGGYSDDLGLFLHQYRAAGGRAQLLAGNVGGDARLLLSAGSDVNGLMFCFHRDPFRLRAVQPIVEDAASRGIELDKYDLFAYVALRVWAQAVTRAGSFDGAKVAAELHAGRFDSPMGAVLFDRKGDIAGSVADWVWYRWRGGKVELEGGR